MEAIKFKSPAMTRWIIDIDHMVKFAQIMRNFYCTYTVEFIGDSFEIHIVSNVEFLPEETLEEIKTLVFKPDY